MSKISLSLTLFVVCVSFWMYDGEKEAPNIVDLARKGSTTFTFSKCRPAKH